MRPRSADRARARHVTGWALHLFSLELRKLFSYRVDFWMNAVGAVGVEMVLAYFLWSAIFESMGARRIGGFGFRSMLLYYLLMALGRRAIVAVDQGLVSTEIYDGTLSRYLVYPVSFFGYKYVGWLAIFALSFAQLLAVFGIFLLVFGAPEDRALSAGGAALGCVALLGASTLYFLLMMAFEMVAFWADNVWSLTVMLRFTMNLLGGGLLPLALFPPGTRAFLRFLPFEYIVSFPVRCLMGEIGWGAWVSDMGILAAWCAVIGGAAWLVWRRGTRQFSGVGI